MNSKNQETDWNALKLAAMQTSDYAIYSRLCKKRAQNLNSLHIKRRKKIKIAILGSANTDFFPELLDFTLDCYGIECEIFNAPYNTYPYQMLDPESPTVSFAPDVVLFANAPFSQPEWPDISMDNGEVERLVDKTSQYWINLCDSIHRNTKCEIIFDNFFSLPWRPHGNGAAKLCGDHNLFISKVNQSIAQNGPAYMHINDVAAMSSFYGISNWLDLKYWHHAKLAISLRYIVPYIKSMSRILASMYGYSRKVLVLDLDNTLWGGGIGDDGLDGIKIGQGSPQGEAFLSFQKYIRKLKDRGILLAVCSKNEEANAKLPFESHPEMDLKLDDFVCFCANWDPKPNNLINMASKLNLGLDSFVFADDNPVECELMRRQLPQVLTIALNEEPADYPALVDEQGPFEFVSLSREDTKRTDQYKANFERESLKVNVSNYNDYLFSLEQRGKMADFEDSRLDRITQLINKTNQFNLTNQRMSRAAVETIMNDECRLSLYLQLSDRFGDNGVIAVVYGTWNKEELTIEGWLMSCRVLKRGVENLTMDTLVTRAIEKEKKYIVGRFIPTGKNKIVEGLYSELGFEISASFDDGASEWILDVQKYEPSNPSIIIEE